MTTTLEIIDRQHPRNRGARFNGATAEARARRELARAVGHPGRFALVDRASGRILAANGVTDDVAAGLPR